MKKDKYEYVTAMVTARTLLRYISDTFGCGEGCSPIFRKHGYSYFRIKRGDNSFFNVSFAQRSVYEKATLKKVSNTWMLPSYFLNKEEKERIFKKLLLALNRFFLEARKSLSE